MTRLPEIGSVYRLVAAEGDALRAQHRERFVLRVPFAELRDAGFRHPNNKIAEKFTFDITDGVIGGRLNLTIEGASTITLQVYDPDWQTEASGLLDLDRDGRLGDIQLELNGVWFQIVKATREDPGDVLQLVFEDMTIALLREHRKPMKASRGSMTRAQFIEKMVNELPGPLRLFYSPEREDRQPVRQPDYPAATPSKDETGFDANVSFKIQGSPADANQKREVATVLTVCDQENVSDLVREAIIVAGLGESGFVPSRVSSAGAKGVFQLMPSWWSTIGWRDTEKQARHFIEHGFYRFGSAKKLATEHPDMSPGEIASRVEGSATDGQNAGYYNGYRDEAQHIISLWRGGASTPSTDTVYELQTYEFTRGLPGHKENSWESMSRLAEEVNWRVYVAGGVVVYATDDWLIGQSARLTLPTPKHDSLIALPTYDWDNGKLAGDLLLKVASSRWSELPGSVVSLSERAWGPIRGRWLIQEVDQDLFDDNDCDITLTKPIKPRREPAPEVKTVSGDTAGDRGSGTGSIFYVGDSLGVGTLKPFRKIVTDVRLDSDVLTGRSSSQGADVLETAFKLRSYDNVVFDLGTNDAKASQLRASLQRARKIAPEAHIYVMTLNGPFQTGAKNQLLDDWKDAHVHVVGWHAVSRGLVTDQNPHPNAAGYEKRAHLLARAMGFE